MKRWLGWFAWHAISYCSGGGRTAVHGGENRNVGRRTIGSPKGCWTMRSDAATVTEGLQQLPDDKRATLMMHIWGGLSFEQIAAILGVSRSTAHRHYTLAMEELRTKFCSSNNSFAESPDHES
ncbi:MAG: sigma factor-like helix-turn-helix DNA-binding protein [Pirellulaceae bacterium]